MRKKIIILGVLFSFVLSATEIFELKNGVKVIFKKVSGIETFACGVLFPGGSAKYKKGQDGLELFALNSLLEGTKKAPFPELSKIFAIQGISPGVFADYDFSALILKSPAKNFEKTLNILFELFSEPELNKKRILIVKNKLTASAKRRRENPTLKLLDLLNEVFYRNHPYAVDPQGKPETFEKFTKEDVLNFLKQNFVSGGIVVGIVAPFNKDKILSLLENTFGNIAKGEIKIPSIPDFSAPETLIIKREPNYKTSYIACKFPIPEVTHPDFPILLAGSEILSNRFEERVRTKAGISYAVWAGISIRKKNYGFFYVSSSYPDSAWKLMMDEVEKIKKEGVKGKEIKETLNMWKTYKFLQVSSTDGALLSLFRSYILTGKPDYIDSILKRIEKVKPGDIKRCAIEYFKNYTRIKLGPLNP